MGKRVFFSYSWEKDELQRSNRERVAQFAAALLGMNWTVWVDYRMITVGSIDAMVVDGIEESDVVVVFLTRSYMRKVQYALRNPRLRDSCCKEWSYAMARQKIIQPVIMEPSLRNPLNWPSGVVTAHLCNNVWVDGAFNDLEKSFRELNARLMRSVSQRFLLPELRRHPVRTPSQVEYARNVGSSRNSFPEIVGGAVLVSPSSTPPLLRCSILPRLLKRKSSFGMRRMIEC
jgi:hypothetical protein